MQNINKRLATIKAGSISIILFWALRSLDLWLHNSPWLTFSSFLFALCLGILVMALIYFPIGGWIGEKLFQPQASTKTIILRRALFVGAYVTFGIFTMAVIIQFYRGLALDITHYIIQALGLGFLFGIVFYYRHFKKQE